MPTSAKSNSASLSLSTAPPEEAADARSVLPRAPAVAHGLIDRGEDLRHGDAILVQIGLRDVLVRPRHAGVGGVEGRATVRALGPPGLAGAHAGRSLVFLHRGAPPPLVPSGLVHAGALAPSSEHLAEAPGRSARARRHSSHRLGGPLESAANSRDDGLHVNVGTTLPLVASHGFLPVICRVVAGVPVFVLVDEVLPVLLLLSLQLDHLVQTGFHGVNGEPVVDADFQPLLRREPARPRELRMVAAKVHSHLFKVVLKVGKKEGRGGGAQTQVDGPELLVFPLEAHGDAVRHAGVVAHRPAVLPQLHVVPPHPRCAGPSLPIPCRGSWSPAAPTAPPPTPAASPVESSDARSAPSHAGETYADRSPHLRVRAADVVVYDVVLRQDAIAVYHVEHLSFVLGLRAAPHGSLALGRDAQVALDDRCAAALRVRDLEVAFQAVPHALGSLLQVRVAQGLDHRHGRDGGGHGGGVVCGRVTEQSVSGSFPRQSRGFRALARCVGRQSAMPQSLLVARRRARARAAVAPRCLAQRSRRVECRQGRRDLSPFPGRSAWLRTLRSAASALGRCARSRRGGVRPGSVAWTRGAGGALRFLAWRTTQGSRTARSLRGTTPEFLLVSHRFFQERCGQWRGWRSATNTRSKQPRNFDEL
eukprot:scaffold1785_cov247-Pinguiococcus_pyrenoidosus.AAC.6